VARDLFILFLCATIAFLLGNGYYKSLRSDVLTIIGHTYKGHTYRRDKEPISYWIGVAIGTFAFLVMVSVTAVMAFLVCVDLFRNSK
jgi:dipeptide/tripeptide permease